ncbi:MAG: TorF family putative porin [Pseudomonadota bacterium]
MNKALRYAFSKTLAVAVLVSGSLFTVAANADVSYNIGWASEYHYRGIFQKTSSASAGIDFEEGGFYIGSWMADVGDGMEIDGYLGYGIETEAGFSASIGFTGYYYTGDFDDTYEEVNLGFGYGLVSIDYAIGEYDGGGGADYDFLSATVDISDTGFALTYGTFGDDFDGDYIEIGYGTSVAELDIGVSLILASDELAGGDEDETLVFTIGKSF